MVKVPPFSFGTAGRIEFGRGRFEEIGKLAASLGSSLLVVCNADRSGDQGLLRRLEELAARESLTIEVVWIAGEPVIEDVDRGLEAARRSSSDVVIGLGGGSAIDAAKAIAGLLTNGGSCLDYMEVIGRGLPIRLAAAPWIAVPTTAGTGAEVTRNAVIGSKEKAYKASIRSPLLLASVALVDPELGVGVRPEITARCGMDALTQCIESYTSSGANPMTDGLALEGIERAARSLRRACRQGDDIAARADMALAALISGITLSNAGLGAVHGLAAPAGARFPVPHGVVCARLLAPVMKVNMEALRSEAPHHPALERYAEVGRLLAGDRGLSGDEAQAAAVESADALVRDLDVPGLASFGFSDDAIPAIVEKARGASSMRFNPVELPASVLEGVLRSAL
jgi:alcohol dehydrogenase class IV